MKIIFCFLVASAIGIAPLSAQPVEPGPNDSPSQATITACTAQVAERWSQMTVTQQAGRTQPEMIQTCAINLEIASYAGAQNQMIVADQEQAAAAKSAHEAAVAEFKASRSAWQAEVQRQKDHYVASYSQWEQDVAACKAGNMKKCAPKN